MSIKQDFEIELFNSKNESVVGILTLEHFPLDPDDSDTNSSVYTRKLEKDPDGAVTYVITVVLLYGLAIVFMIASHVFVKKKEERLENQITLVNKYIAQAPRLRERGARESYRKLKHSIVPVVAKSGARDLISRRKSFAPFLIDAGITINNSVGRRLSVHSDSDSDDDSDLEEVVGGKKSTPGPFRTFLEVPGKPSEGSAVRRLPSISEEDDSEKENIIATDTFASSNMPVGTGNGIPATVTIENETNPTKTVTANGSVPYRYDYRIPSHFKHSSSQRYSCEGTFHKQVPVIVITEGSTEEMVSTKPDLHQVEEGPDLTHIDETARCLSIESLSPYPESSESWQEASSTSEYDSYNQELLSDKSEAGDLYQMTWVSDNSINSAYTYGLSAPQSGIPGNRSPFSGDLQQADTDDTFLL